MSRWIPVKNFVSNPTSRTRVFATPPLLCHSSSSMPLAHRARRPRHVHVERARDFIKNVERARDFIKNKGTVECHGKLVQQTLVYCSDSTTPHSGPHQASSSSSHMPLLPSVSLSLSFSLSLSLADAPTSFRPLACSIATSRCTSRPAQNQTGTCRHIHITQDSCYSHVPAAWDHWAHTKTHWGQSPAEGLTRRAFFFPQRSRPTVCDDGGCGQRWRDQRTLKTNVD